MDTDVCGRPGSIAAKRVTLICGAVGPVGGMERHALELIRGLTARDFEVSVISRSYDSRIDGTVWHRVRSPRRPSCLATPSFLLFASWVQWRRSGDSLVHRSGAATLLRAHVTTCHFCVRALPAGLVRSSHRGLLYRWNALLSGRFLRAAERLMVSNSQQLVAVSRGLAADLARWYPRVKPLRKVAVIPNGVDLERFSMDRSTRDQVRTKWGIPPGAVALAFCGSEWERKGLQLAIEAVALVADCHLFVIGRGDLERFQQVALLAGAATRVHFVGQVEDTEHFYAASDGFLLPSKYEGLSLASLEALASGLPLLLPDVPGASEILVDGENGFVIKPVPAEIAERIRQLAASSELRSRLSHASRMLAASFSWDAMVQAYAELYDTVLERAASQSRGK